MTRRTESILAVVASVLAGLVVLALIWAGFVFFGGNA